MMNTALSGKHDEILNRTISKILQKIKEEMWMPAISPAVFKPLLRCDNHAIIA